MKLAFLSTEDEMTPTGRYRIREQRAELRAPSQFSMKQALLIFALVIVFLGTTEPAFGRGPKVTGNFCRQSSAAVAINASSDDADLAFARRYAQAGQVMSMHGVRYTPDIYLQFYADADLVAYLAGISDLIVLPVYSESPIHFRHGEVVVVSTAFILQSRSEEELFEAIALDGGCPLAPGDVARFNAVQAKLELGIAQYYEAMMPPLRCREVRQLQLRRR